MCHIGSSPNGSPVNSTVKASFVAAPAYKQFSTSGVKVKVINYYGHKSAVTFYS